MNFVIKILFLWEDIHGAVKQESKQLQLPQKHIISHASLATQNNNSVLITQVENTFDPYENENKEHTSLDVIADVNSVLLGV